MNAPPVSAPIFDEACPRKTRCENRWTAAEDKILLAQVLKGDSPATLDSDPYPQLTSPKLTAARSAGDLSLPRCQEGTTSPAGRGTFSLALSSSYVPIRPLVPDGFIPSIPGYEKVHKL